MSAYNDRALLLEVKPPTTSRGVVVDSLQALSLIVLLGLGLLLLGRLPI